MKKEKYKCPKCKKKRVSVCPELRCVKCCVRYC